MVVKESLVHSGLLNTHRIQVPHELVCSMSEIRAELGSMAGDLSSPAFQDKILGLLMAHTSWRSWIEQQRVPIGIKPVLLDSGLGLERDDELSRVLLVGVARSFEPENLVPPYAIGNLAVTEVIARKGSTPESHSVNDLPAPPHTAGFFEPVPPRSCYFTCIRPHPGGGAETAVVNLDAVLDKAPQSLIDEWSEKTYLLRTSRRLGREIKPFKLLSWIDGLPFLRYRKEYTVGFSLDRSLKLLEELLVNPANHFSVPLGAGETLIHWNGTPHLRTAQLGKTPESLNSRRKLIRCRTSPKSAWAKFF